MSFTEPFVVAVDFFTSPVALLFSDSHWVLSRACIRRRPPRWRRLASSAVLREGVSTNSQAVLQRH
eukprot:404752-Pyramimonas_sp.AAC.1